MNEPPIPKVHETDVARIIRRDFSTAMEFQVRQRLAALQDGSPRIRLAVLKLADGDLQALIDAVAAANADPRDVLVAAEFPAYFNLPDTATTEEREASRGADWRQYQEWLAR